MYVYVYIYIRAQRALRFCAPSAHFKCILNVRLFKMLLNICIHTYIHIYIYICIYISVHREPAAFALWPYFKFRDPQTQSRRWFRGSRRRYANFPGSLTSHILTICSAEIRYLFDRTRYYLGWGRRVFYLFIWPMAVFFLFDRWWSFLYLTGGL